MNSSFAALLSTVISTLAQGVDQCDEEWFNPRAFWWHDDPVCPTSSKVTQNICLCEIIVILFLAADWHASFTSLDRFHLIMRLDTLVDHIHLTLLHKLNSGGDSVFTYLFFLLKEEGFCSSHASLTSKLTFSQTNNSKGVCTGSWNATSK